MYRQTRTFGIAVFLALVMSVSANALVVQGFDGSRSATGNVSGESFSFVTGPPYAEARDQLSQNGSIMFLGGVSEVTPGALQGVDVFVISPLNQELSAAEICALETFVNNGGALLETRNLGVRPPILGTVPGEGRDDVFPAIVDPSSVLVSGVSSIGMGFNYAFSQLGDATAVTTNSVGGPNLIQLNEGPDRSGRAVFIGDEEVFMTGTFSGERTGKLLGADNATLLLNVFAFLDGAPGLDPDADFLACALPVSIDIKPGSDPNSIHPGSKGVIPVAILTTRVSAGEAVDFDATTVDPLSVAFGPDGAAEAHGRGHVEDADGDGDPDLVLHFKTRETGIARGNTEARLTGTTASGHLISGVDPIRTVGGRAGKPVVSHGVSPSPFNPSTTIRYALSERVEVRLAIYNTLGQEVRVLVNAVQGAGQYRVRWDGLDAAGREVTSGVYVYRLVAGTDAVAQKMILAK